MRILFVVPYVPTPIRVRSYNLIRELSRRDHRVTLATVYTDERERDELLRLSNGLEDVWAVKMPKARSLVNCLLALPKPDTPLQSVYSWHPTFAGKLARRVHERSQQQAFDVVHVEHLRGARYGLALAKHQNGGVPIVWDSVDCISLLFEQASRQSNRPASRWIAGLELDRTRRFEQELLGQFEKTLVTSESDRQALSNLANGSKPPAISVLPNGVDLEYFCPDPDIQPNPEAVVLSGKMSYHANVAMVDHFVRDILPHIQRQRPQIEVWIVGKKPTAQLRALAERPGVKVTGEVSDLREYVRRAKVAAAPITYGAGIQNKVLEAMACGTPVVTTSLAVNSLGAQQGRHLLVADEPVEFANAVIDLLEQPALHQRIATMGRRFVEQHHAWTDVTQRLERCYAQAGSVRGAAI